MLKTYKDTVVLVENNKLNFDFNKLRLNQKKFYGKLPDMFLQIDPLTLQDINFDEIAYARLSLAGYSEEKIINNLMKYLLVAQTFYQNNFIKDANTMKIFFNIILIKELTDTTRSNLEKLTLMYKNMQNSKNLIKFPNLYVKFHENYNDILLKNKEIEEAGDKNIIFINLLNISAVRTLNNEEEKYIKLNYLLGYSYILLTTTQS